MNVRLFLASVVSVCVLLVSGKIAQAQFNPNIYRYQFNPYDRPALSPYLNLLRGGNPAANYYLGVVPEKQRRENAALFGSAILDLYQKEQALPEDPSLLDPALPKLPPTGHNVGFQYYNPFFNFPNRQPTFLPFSGGSAR